MNTKSTLFHKKRWKIRRRINYKFSTRTHRVVDRFMNVKSVLEKY